MHPLIAYALSPKGELATLYIGHDMDAAVKACEELGQHLDATCCIVTAPNPNWTRVYDGDHRRAVASEKSRREEIARRMALSTKERAAEDALNAHRAAEAAVAAAECALKQAQDLHAASKEQAAAAAKVLQTKRELNALETVKQGLQTAAEIVAPVAMVKADSLPANTPAAAEEGDHFSGS